MPGKLFDHLQAKNGLFGRVVQQVQSDKSGGTWGN